MKGSGWARSWTSARMASTSSSSGKPTRRTTVKVESGRISHHVAVFGDRVWRKSPKGLIPSEPEPFVEMPLANDRAFGGKVLLEGLEIPHPHNPAGRGFYLSEGEAEGKPLPNL